MMKALPILLGSLLAAGVQAQTVLTDALGGAALGAGLGAMIGAASGTYYRGPCGSYYYGGGNAGQGAAIGAGVGLVAGTLFGLARQNAAQSAPPQTVYYQPAPVVGYGYAEMPVYTAVPGVMPAGYTPAPMPAAAPAPAPAASTRPNYAIGGTLVGAASGALIGQGVSQQPGKGAAIGAASGLVVGLIAEGVARNQEKTSAAQPPPTDGTSYQPATYPVAQTTSPQAWPSQAPPLVPAPQHQIASAPRVPDAPRF